MDPSHVKGYGVRVQRSGRHPTDDAVFVAYDFPRKLAGSRHPLRIRSSDRVPGGLPGAFGAVRDLVRRRRQGGGAKKGRVLYLLRGRQPLAVLAYHVPDRGPLEVIAVGADRMLTPQDAVRLQAHLLACLEEAGIALGRATRIAWATSTENTAGVAELAFGFRRSKKPKHSRAKYYLTRPVTDRGGTGSP